MSRQERSPAFQFYPRDFMSDANVLLMSSADRGDYIWLLSICWLEGYIPADDEALARLCGHQERCSTLVKNCFIPDKKDSSHLLHSRLEKERKKQREWAIKSSRAGRASANAKKMRTLTRNGGSQMVEPNCNGGSTVVQPKANIAFAFASAFANKETTCPEKREAVSRGPAEMTPKLPLEDGTEYAVPEEIRRGWLKAYPGLLVDQELERMRAWLQANPQKRKTARGILRFCNAWLSRAQQDPQPGGQTKPKLQTWSYGPSIDLEEFKRTHSRDYHSPEELAGCPLPFLQR